MHSVLPKSLRGREPSRPPERAADGFAAKVEDLRVRLHKNLVDAQQRQTKYAKGEEMLFKVGDKVWLSTKHIRTSRLSKKLDYKRIGPYRVCKVVNKNAYKLELPATLRIHDVFHVSLLDLYREPVPGQPSGKPVLVISDDLPDSEEYWEVERILDSRVRLSGKERKRRIEYLVQWAGYSHIYTTWEPEENLEHCGGPLGEFYKAYPNKPRPRRR